MISSLPSPFTSPKVADREFVPVAKVTAFLKVPLPLPKSTLALLELDPKFAVVMSSMPSPFTSPKVTERGLTPGLKISGSLKVPLPLPMSTTTSLPGFGVTMSSLPSPFKSPKAT